MANEEKTQNWPELAIGLYDKLTGRNAKITYSFKNFKLGIPDKVGSDQKAEWEMNGELTISTSEA
jgi:hypothetical protein